MVSGSGGQVVEAFPTLRQLLRAGHRGLAKCLKAMTVDRKEKNQTKQEKDVGGQKIARLRQRGEGHRKE